MNDEPLLAGCVSPNPPRPLEERLAQRPGLRARLHPILDPLEASVADGLRCPRGRRARAGRTAPARQEVLVRRANEAAARAQAQVRTRHPHASQPGKKKFLKWQTTFGWIAVEETQ